MNNTENPLSVPSLTTMINHDTLESLKLKLSTMNVSADHQNEEPCMYQKFLEFIIDISQWSNPSTYFEKIFDNLFEESLEQDDPNNKSSIKALLVYVLREDVLDSEDVKNLWRVMRDSADINSILFEILSQSPNNNIKESLMQNILSHVLNAPINEIKDIDYQMASLILEICKESHELLSKQLDSFWQALSSTPTFDAVFHIQKARKLGESYPNTTDEEDLLSQKSLVQYLCKEKDLLNKVVRELESLIVKSSEVKDQQFSQANQANEIIAFITFLVTSIPGCSDILTCNAIVSLWRIGLIASDFKDLQKQLFVLTKKIIESKISKDLDIEELVIFFQEKSHSKKDWNFAKFTKEAFDCFRTIFIAVNQHLHNISEVILLTSCEQDFFSRFERLMIRENEGYFEEDGDFLFQVNILPNKLEGYTTLWELACMTEDQSIASKAKDLLVCLHTNLNITLHSQVKEIREEFFCLCFREFRETPLDEETSENKIIRYLELLHSFIDQTNKDNPNRPMLHSELGHGEFLKIILEKDKNGFPIFTRIKVKSNTLMSDILCKTKQLFEINNLSIYLEEQNSKLVISENQNTRTLEDLGIKNDATLVVKPRAPKAYLIQYDKTLNPQAKLIFTKWFENFSDNQKMSPQQCANLIQSCTNDGCHPNDRRIFEIFARYDDDKDSYLTLDDFLNFYHDACIKRPWVVWNNLLAQKEAPDLKPPKKKQGKTEFSAGLNAASLISSNKEYIQVLFSLLESEDEIAVKALQLLNRLPTDPQTFVDIVTLKGVRDILDSDSFKPDWCHVLDRNNIYKLFYCLGIVEYLIDTKRLDEDKDEDESEDVKRLWSPDPRLLEYKKSWFSDFIACGGAERLNDILGKLSLFKAHPTITTYMKRIRCLIEKIQ